MKNELIKRAQIGGYVKADTTGTNKNWEVGRITKTDEKSIWFESATDGQEVKISRKNAFKATAAEYEAATKEPRNLNHVVKAAVKKIEKRIDKEDLNTDIDDAGEVAQILDESNGPERSIVKKCYRKNYVNSHSAAGNTSKNNGDAVAVLLEGKTLEEAYDALAQTSGEDMSKAWSHLNIGQQRMLIGNKIRKIMREQGAM